MFRMSGTEDYFPDAESMPMFRHPEDLMVIVAGARDDTRVGCRPSAR